VDRPTWVPEEIDFARPSASRVYDFYLGGSHNFAVDRDLGRQAIRVVPELPRIMQANRAFLRRAVEFLVDAGVRQFLDIGSGIPTAGNVHEVAQVRAPECRVVYVDIDPVAVAHSQAILDGDDRTAVVQADLREPVAVLGDPELRRLLDLDRPVALLLFAVLHFVPDDQDPGGLVGRYRDALAPGSWLALSHGTDEGAPEEITRALHALYRRTPTPAVTRSRDQVAGLFAGFDVVEPGVVALPDWRPEPDDDRRPVWSAAYGGVGRKP